MNTLQTVCFQFQENDEASKECIRIMNERYPYPFSDGWNNWLYYVSNGTQGCYSKTSDIESNMVLISPSDYLALLTQPNQLTVEDLKVGNEFRCTRDVLMTYGRTEYFRNTIYKCNHEGCITNFSGNILHWWNIDIELLNRHFILHSSQPEIETERRNVPCRNCNELLIECACKRNKCIECGTTVGNTTFTVCDSCWDILETKRINKIVPVQEEVKGDKIIIGDNENLKCIADQIEQVFKSHLDDETRIELSAKTAYYYFKNGINQYRKWKEESKSETAHIQQQLKEAKELLKELESYLDDEVAIVQAAVSSDNYACINDAQLPSLYLKINQFLTRNK